MSFRIRLNKSVASVTSLNCCGVMPCRKPDGYSRPLSPVTIVHAISSADIEGCGYAQLPACSGSICSEAAAAIAGYWRKSSWSDVDWKSNSCSMAKSARMAPELQFSKTTCG